jgi:hypothetical protein
MRDPGQKDQITKAGRKVDGVVCGGLLANRRKYSAANTTKDRENFFVINSGPRPAATSFIGRRGGRGMSDRMRLPRLCTRGLTTPRICSAELASMFPRCAREGLSDKGTDPSFRWRLVKSRPLRERHFPDPPSIKTRQAGGPAAGCLRRRREGSERCGVRKCPFALNFALNLWATMIAHACEHSLNRLS